MTQRHIADERILRISELPLPGAVIQPRESAVDVEAGAAFIAHGVVRFANPRKEDVAHRVRGIEADE